jgi:AcrR family transcriptional regulator
VSDIRQQAAPRKRTGRRIGSTTSHHLILDAARSEFSRHGYEGTTMRAVAQAAGVDAALIHHFFVSKAGLFTVVTRDVLVPPDLQATVAGGLDGAGERVARAFLEFWDTPDVNLRLVALLRSATAFDGAAVTLRQFVGREALGSLTSTLAGGGGGTRAELRASLLGSHLLGIALVRYVILGEPLASLSTEHVVAYAADTCQHYLAGRI